MGEFGSALGNAEPNSASGRVSANVRRIRTSRCHDFVNCRPASYLVKLIAGHAYVADCPRFRLFRDGAGKHRGGETMLEFLSRARRRSWRWRATIGAATSVFVVAAALSGVAVQSAPASADSSSVVFDGSPGTGAPPSTLGPYTTQAFGADSQPLNTDVDGVTGPTGAVSFSPALEHLQVGNGWETWSNGYTGDVYYTGGAESTTVTLPAGTNAFYLYAEPAEFESFTVTATAQDGTSSGPVSVEGESGATYLGFYGTGGATISSITVTCDDEDGFAIGEFGIAGTSEVAAVRFAPRDAEKSLTNFTVNTPGLPVVKDDGPEPVLDRDWAPPGGCADGLTDPQDYDYVDCASPPTGTPSKDWPVIYTAGSPLSVNEAVFFSPTEEKGAQLTATASIGGQSLTLPASALTEKKAGTAYKLTATDLSFTGTLPSVAGVDTLTITWSITPSGGSPAVVGASTHQVYVTAGSYVAPTGPTQKIPPYITLLDLGTRAAAGQSGQTAVFDGIWSEFDTKNIAHPILNPQTGQTTSGPDFSYYTNVYTSIGAWWNSNPFLSCPNSLTELLSQDLGRCGTWAQFLALVLAYQGVSSEPVGLLGVPGFNFGPDPTPSDAASDYAFMLVGPGLWKWGTPNATGTYQYADPITISSGQVTVGAGGFAYNASTTPIAQGQNDTPPEWFLTGDHAIDYVQGGFVDPSYGNPASSTPYPTIGAYEQSAIAGFAVLFHLDKDKWKPVKALAAYTLSDLVKLCSTAGTCQFRATPYQPS